MSTVNRDSPIVWSIHVRRGFRSGGTCTCGNQAVISFRKANKKDNMAVLLIGFVANFCCCPLYLGQSIVRMVCDLIHPARRTWKLDE